MSLNDMKSEYCATSPHTTFDCWWVRYVRYQNEMSLWSSVGMIVRWCFRRSRFNARLILLRRVV
jgi:hypothetical protein